MVIFAKAFIIVTKALLGYCYRVRADIRVHRSYLAHVIAYLDKVLEWWSAACYCRDRLLLTKDHGHTCAFSCEWQLNGKEKLWIVPWSTSFISAHRGCPQPESLSYVMRPAISIIYTYLFSQYMLLHFFSPLRIRKKRSLILSKTPRLLHWSGTTLGYIYICIIYMHICMHIYIYNIYAFNCSDNAGYMLDV